MLRTVAQPGVGVVRQGEIAPQGCGGGDEGESRRPVAEGRVVGQPGAAALPVSVNPKPALSQAALSVATWST